MRSPSLETKSLASFDRDGHPSHWSISTRVKVCWGLDRAKHQDAIEVDEDFHPSTIILLVAMKAFADLCPNDSQSGDRSLDHRARYLTAGSPGFSLTTHSSRGRKVRQLAVHAITEAGFEQTAPLEQITTHSMSQSCIGSNFQSSVSKLLLLTVMVESPWVCWMKGSRTNVDVTGICK